MIRYKIKNNYINIDFKDFIFLKMNGSTIYKNFYKDFSSLIYDLDTHIDKISEIIFNNNQLYLNDGNLHNLFKPSQYVHNSFANTLSPRYYFKNNQLFIFSNKPLKREKDFEDYKNQIIYYKNNIIDKNNIIKFDVEKERNIELRKLKLNKLISN